MFQLDENALADRLFEIDEISDGCYRWSETAGLKQLIREHEMSADESLCFIDDDYLSHAKRDAA